MPRDLSGVESPANLFADLDALFGMGEGFEQTVCEPHPKYENSFISISLSFSPAPDSSRCPAHIPA
jgi:hypothetical protein